MEEWKTYRLGEIADVFTGYPFSGELYSNKGVRVVRGENIGEGSMNWTPRRDKRWSLPFDRHEEYKLVNGDVVVAMDGNVGKNKALITESDLPALLAQRVARLRGTSLLDQRYLYYTIFSTSFAQYIECIKTGTTISHISVKQIKDFELSLPPLPLQRRISSLLSSLDAKIETNRRINARLEEMAQALFRSWFIDFTPFKQQEFVEDEYGRRPKGWEVGTVEDLCINLASGSTPSSMNSAYYSGEIKWFTTKELKDSFLLDSEKHISEEAHNNSSTKMFPKGTVLMAIYAAPTVGRLGILTCDATFNQAAVGLLPKKEVGTYYMYLYLKNERDTFNRLAVGAAQQNLSVKFVKTYKTIIPPTNILLDFNSKITPLFEKIKVCEQEISRLAALRDTLLPKLMSGEIIPEEITASRATRFL